MEAAVFVAVKSKPELLTVPFLGVMILAISTPQNAMDQWRKDEHWNFVISSNTLIEAGYAYNSCSDFGGYFTVDFGG
jgi:hypothetical protein